MLHPARLAIVLSGLSLALVGLTWADDSVPGTAKVVLTPAPSPEDSTGADSEASAEGGNGSDAPAEVETPPPEAASQTSVPVPQAQTPSPSPAEPENGMSIKIGSAAEEKWCDLDDFSYSRWRPLSRTQWMPGHRDRFGMFTLAGDSAAVLENWGSLASTHGYAVHFLNGPVRTDLPSKVFDFTWGLFWNAEITPGWSASLAGQVGIFTDFEDSVRDGWRFPAHAVVFHDWTETIEGVAGIKYFDRENLPPLPVLGLILRPDERVRIEAIFPEPRIALLVHTEEGSQKWLSLSGEIGGGEWAIERSNTDLADVVTYNDYNAILGFHHFMTTGHDTAFELGYTFARDLEYRSGVGDFQPEDTFFIRWSSRF